MDAQFWPIQVSCVGPKIDCVFLCECDNTLCKNMNLQCMNASVQSFIVVSKTPAAVLIVARHFTTGLQIRKVTASGGVTGSRMNE